MKAFKVYTNETYPDGLAMMYHENGARRSGILVRDETDGIQFLSEQYFQMNSLCSGQDNNPYKRIFDQLDALSPEQLDALPQVSKGWLLYQNNEQKKNTVQPVPALSAPVVVPQFKSPLSGYHPWD